MSPSIGLDGGKFLLRKIPVEVYVSGHDKTRFKDNILMQAHT